MLTGIMVVLFLRASETAVGNQSRSCSRPFCLSARRPDGKITRQRSARKLSAARRNVSRVFEGVRFESTHSTGMMISAKAVLTRQASAFAKISISWRFCFKAAQIAPPSACLMRVQGQTQADRQSGEPPSGETCLWFCFAASRVPV